MVLLLIMQKQIADDRHQNTNENIERNLKLMKIEKCCEILKNQ